jgi:hypothetical protein
MYWDIYTENRRMRQKFLALFLIFLLAACGKTISFSTYENEFAQIKIGQTLKEVEDIMKTKPSLIESSELVGLGYQNQEYSDSKHKYNITFAAAPGIDYKVISKSQTPQKEGK